MTTARLGEHVVVTKACKTCLECHNSLPVSAFHRKGIYWDSRCKPCALSQKKNQYLTKKCHKINDYKNILIRPYTMEVDIKGHDLVSLLEAFLLEECVNEQRISA
jgi:flavoprotein